MSNYYGGYGNPYAATGYNPYAAYGQPTGYPAQSYGYGGSADASSNALWMGDIENWMEESYLMSLFALTGECTSVKMMKNKTPSDKGGSVGYAFIYFNSPDAASRALNNFNGQPIPGLAGRYFRLNWASHGNKSSPGTATIAGMPTNSVPPANSDALSLFVGDLANDITDVSLLYAFHAFYPSAYSAKVVYDPNTNQSKSYGFVYFRDEKERNRALTEMQGYQLSYRPIRVNIASKKNAPAPTPAPAGPLPSQNPLNTLDNKTVFVYGIDSTIDQDTLRSSFSRFGDITLIKVFPSKCYSFIDFATHEQAEGVINALPNGAVIGTCTVKISWGKPSTPSSGGSSSYSSSSSSSSSYAPPVQNYQSSSQSQPYVPPVQQNNSYVPPPVKSSPPMPTKEKSSEEEYDPEGSEDTKENTTASTSSTSAPTTSTSASTKRELEENTEENDEKESKRARTKSEDEEEEKQPEKEEKSSSEQDSKDE